MPQTDPVMDFLLSRRSSPPALLRAPAPEGAALERILTAVRMELRKDARAVNEAELKWTPRAAPTAPREPAVGTPS